MSTPSNKLLLNPGPTNTRLETKQAQMDGSDVCHRTEDFYKVLNSTKTLLLQRLTKDTNITFDNETWHVALIGGSGTTAMEAMMSSLGNASSATKVIKAGKYGERISDMLNIYNVEHDVISANSVEELQKDESNMDLFFVENETTNGEKYSLEYITSIYPNAKLFVDTTSAFGSSDYSNHLDQIQAMSFCSNKCLQSTPGLGIVIWRKSLPVFEKNHYCYLNRYTKTIPPFTVPVQVISALEATLRVSDDNTDLFDERRDNLISSFQEIGINCIDKKPCNSIIGFTHPKLSYDELNTFLSERDIVIYEGITGYKNSFRVATMSVEFDNKFDYIQDVFKESTL